MIRLSYPLTDCFGDNQPAELGRSFILDRLLDRSTLFCSPKGVLALEVSALPSSMPVRAILWDRDELDVVPVSVTGAEERGS